jgi:hypothetical protein
MSEPYFPEEQARNLLAEFEATGNIASINSLLEICQPLIAKLTYARGVSISMSPDDAINICLAHLSTQLMRGKFDAARGRLFSWITKCVERELISLHRRETRHSGRTVPLDDYLMDRLSTNGATHDHALADIRYRVMQVRSASTCPHERAAQRWLCENLLESNFVFRRHQAADSMVIVFGIGPRQARRLYDVTILSIRRLLLSDRRLKPIQRSQLVGTRGSALWQYRSQLSAEEFSKLAFLMRGLAPVIIGPNGLSLKEVLFGSARETPLFPSDYKVESAGMPVSAASRLTLESRMPAAPSPSRSVVIEEKPRTDLAALVPTSLLDPSDFVRNLRELQRSNKRPFSVAKALREALVSGRPSGMELEISQELKLLGGRSSDPNAFFIPAEALGQRVDLDSVNASQLVPERIEPTILPYLRNRSICGILGATIIENLSQGSHRLPRMSGTANAVWQPEAGGVTPTNPTFDSDVILAPSRLESQVLVSRQLVQQSSPDIERYLVADISAAIGVAVDAAALAGSGLAPIPTGLLSLPANPAGTYAYGSRSPDVTWGGAPTWSKVLAHELTLETARVSDDGTLAWALSPDVRDKWAQTEMAAGFPRYLLENGKVNNRTALSTFNLPAGKAILGKWSDVILASWAGIEVLINEFSYASYSKILVRVSALMAINFKFAVSFVTSADSAAQ